MYQLIVSALQKRGINRHHRLHAIAGEPRSEGEGVLLSNADVEITVGIGLGKFHQTRTLTHSGSDADQALIYCRHVT